jgi:two-component system invasion response regulator UvrY
MLMKRVLIADDHALMRKGLKETLEEEVGGLTFGEASNSAQVVQMVADHKWDLVLLDINMEGRSGLDALADIRDLRPKLPVLILSMYPEQDFAVRALKAGAAGYISKRLASEELVAAVKKVLDGGRYITSTVADQLAADLHRERERARHEALSNREFQILQMIATGKSLKEIASTLGISVKTVGTYHGRLLSKMSMTSDIELTRYALLNKLVE